MQILSKGHFPFIPHLTHYVDLRAKQNKVDITRREYLKWDEVWLRCCDAFYLIGESKGANMELNIAKKLGIPIYYDLKDIPDLSSKH